MDFGARRIIYGKELNNPYHWRVGAFVVFSGKPFQPSKTLDTRLLSSVYTHQTICTSQSMNGTRVHFTSSWLMRLKLSLRGESSPRAQCFLPFAKLPPTSALTSIPSHLP